MLYQVLDKDIIENEIVPNLPKPKRGFLPKAPLVEIVNCILYKLKTGVQWAYLPVKSLFEEYVLSYQSVFYPAAQSLLTLSIQLFIIIIIFPKLVLFCYINYRIISQFNF